MKTKKKTMTKKPSPAVLAAMAAELTRDRLRAPERAAFARLCGIAARLGVPVIHLRVWPPSHTDSYGVFVRRRSRTSDELFRGRHANVPVIFLRTNNPYTLAHEISHAAYARVFHRPTGDRDHYQISKLLNRVAKRHGLGSYYRSSHVELQAEICGRRLLGETLPPTLRRFSERTFRQLEHAL